MNLRIVFKFKDCKLQFYEKTKVLLFSCESSHACQSLAPLVETETRKNKENKGNVYQRKETIDCLPNSPCLHLRKCVKNSMENIHTDVRVGRGK